MRRSVAYLAGWPDPPPALPTVIVERAQNPAHGDYSVTLPLKLAKTLRRSPLAIAGELAGAIRLPGGFAGVEVAPPGFINIRIEPSWLQAQIEPVIEAGEAWGHNNSGGGRSVQVEFVSANPTGPLLFSHARGAVVGDVAARILEASGYAVEREYYINDKGKQMRLFGESIRARMLGQQAPEGGYAGDYLTEIAAVGGSRGVTDAGALAEIGAEWVQERIWEDLKRLGVRHDRVFLETSLYDGWDREIMEKLRALDRIVEKDGAVWFRTGTDKDEVLVRRDGYPTYFASDIFYHLDKFERRGFDRVVDVWGADHQGQVGRLKEALAILGVDPARLIVLMIQLVSVKRGEETVRMSKRAGVGVSLQEMLDEVGPDALRYFFLLRSADAQIEFDVDLAKRQSSDNPVYYAQYAHARLANVLALGARADAEPALERLDSVWELDLVRIMLRWPDAVREAAEAIEPHRLAFYTDELAASVHRFYKNCRIVSDDAGLTAARLQLTRAARLTLANALGVVGVSAPDRM